MGDMAPPSFNPETAEAISISNQIMIGTLILLFFVVAFSFFLRLYAKHYWSTNAEDRAIVSWRRQLAHQNRRTSSRLKRKGLDLTALQSLPVVVYDPKDFKEELECVVCLSEVSEGQKARILPKCNHGFHVDCIDMWFQSHSTCPLCRNPVISNPNSLTDANNSSEVQDDNSSDSSESDYSDDDRNDSESDSSLRTREVPVFPANVLFWGNQIQVSSFGQSDNAAVSASASSSGVNRPNCPEIVIEIPINHEFCLPSPPLDEAKTPVMTRLASLKRLWSFGKRVTSPSSRASSSQ